MVVVGARARVTSEGGGGFGERREESVSSCPRNAKDAAFGVKSGEKHPDPSQTYPHRFFGVSRDCADALEICVAGRALAELTIR
jgi:hypothetical protein